METVTLPAALVQQIANYLVQRPYGEVAVLLSAMQEAVAASQAEQDANARRAAGQP